MFERFNTYICGVLLTGALVLSPSVRAGTLPIPTSDNSRDFRVFADSSYFSTQANFDSGGGSFSSLGNGRYYRLISGGVGAEYWLLERFTIITRFDFARAESYDGSFSRYSNDPVEAVLGGRYILNGDAWELTAEVLGAYPFNRVDASSDKVLTGEGTMWLQGGAWASYQLASLKPYIYVGYRYQDDGRASHVMWRAGSEYAIAPVTLELEANGAVVAVSDADSDNRVNRDLHVVQVDGASYKFYAVDPSWIALKGGLTFEFSRDLRLRGSYEQTLNGKNYAAGFTALLGLEWAMNLGADRATPPRVLENTNETPESQNFEPEAPKYDSSLFKDNQNKRPSKKLPPKRKRAKPVDIDKSLEDVQKSLEH